MSGFPQYQILKTQTFKGSVGKLKKCYGKDKYTFEKILQELAKRIDKLYSNPTLGSEEPLPKKVVLGCGVNLRKIRFSVGKGESGKLRVLYILDKPSLCISLLSVYNHKQHKGRPPDSEITALVRGCLLNN